MIQHHLDLSVRDGAAWAALKQKALELALLKSRFREAQARARSASEAFAVEHFADAFAHENNQPLAIMSASAASSRLLLEQDEPDNRVARATITWLTETNCHASELLFGLRAIT